MEPTLAELWTAGGLLLGFEFSAIAWRISREVEVARAGDITWLPYCDWLVLFAMIVSGGLFLVPILLDSTVGLRFLLGLVIVLLVSYPFALAGHYELYVPGKRSMCHFPRQEKIALSLAVASVVGYGVAFGLLC